jgi:HIV Tat-specific factor 1
MTVKFKDAHSAQACVLKMNGRFFDGRRVSPSLHSPNRPNARGRSYTGKERYQRSGAGKSFGEGEDGDEEEQERLDHFAQWLVEKEGEEGED